MWQRLPAGRGHGPQTRSCTLLPASCHPSPDSLGAAGHQGATLVGTSFCPPLPPPFGFDPRFRPLPGLTPLAAPCPAPRLGSSLMHATRVLRRVRAAQVPAIWLSLAL